MTPQRLMILAAIQNSDGHVSAEEIHDQVRAQYPQLHISTVYRTLELLKEQGLVAEADLGEGRTRYHLAEKGQHHHLVCEKCGAIFELSNSLLLPLGEAILREHRFRANLTHFTIFGRCARC